MKGHAARAESEFDYNQEDDVSFLQCVQAVARRVMLHFVTASEIIPGLWQGSKPPAGPEVGRVADLLALCAMEYQPGHESYPGLARIVRANLDDAEPTPSELAEARVAARHVAMSLASGLVCLVTCQAGLNRSGLVAGLALRSLGFSGRDTVRLVRRARGEKALSNPWFREIGEHG